MHQKCSNYALTNLLFGLCRSVWRIDPLVIHPNPHLGTLARPSTPEVLQARECTLNPYPFIVFTFGFIIESINEFGGASHEFTFPTSNLKFFVKTKYVKVAKIHGKWTLRIHWTFVSYNNKFNIKSRKSKIGGESKRWINSHEGIGPISWVENLI